jgi:hypothetical protein
LAVREVFRDLFHPSEKGSLSDYLGRTIFNVFRHSPPLLPLAGPLALVLVIFSWALLQATGFALIYWAAFPGSFQLADGRPFPEQYDFLKTLYFSIEAMTTMGFGDMLPKPDWLRLVVAAEALTGFAFLTASVSWTVLLYPALARLRTLARRTSILVHASASTRIALPAGDFGPLMNDLALGVIRARVDFIYFPIIYYFHASHAPSSLAVFLPDLVRLAEVGSKPEAPEHVRLASAALNAALDDLAEALRDHFVPGHPSDTQSVFRAYSEHHLENRRRRIE